MYNVALVSPAMLARPAPAPKAAPVKPAPRRSIAPPVKPQPKKEPVALKKDKPRRLKPKPVKKQPDPSKLLARRLKRLERRVAAEQRAERKLASALSSAGELATR